MADLELNTKISNIVKFEKESGVSIQKAFSGGDMSIAVLVDLIKACMPESNNKDAQIDEYVAEHGFEALADKLSEAMKQSGFLPKDAQQEAKAEAK